MVKLDVVQGFALGDKFVEERLIFLQFFGVCLLGWGSEYLQKTKKMDLEIFSILLTISFKD